MDTGTDWTFTTLHLLLHKERLWWMDFFEMEVWLSIFLIVVKVVCNQSLLDPLLICKSVGWDLIFVFCYRGLFSASFHVENCVCDWTYVMGYRQHDVPIVPETVPAGPAALVLHATVHLQRDTGLATGGAWGCTVSANVARSHKHTRQRSLNSEHWLNQLFNMCLLKWLLCHALLCIEWLSVCNFWPTLVNLFDSLGLTNFLLTLSLLIRWF